MIGQIEILAMTLNYFAKCRVVNMTDPGKQMMFNLVIKSSHGPGNKLIMWSKISCGLYLVHRPLCFNHLIIYTYGFKFRPFYCMCQLKNKRNDHTCNYSHSQVT